MITRFSNCHFADVMITSVRAKHLKSEPEEITKCSFCGEICEIVPLPLGVDKELELDLRRWKDGDISFQVLNLWLESKLRISWYIAVMTAQKSLQVNQMPRYVLDDQTHKWEERK